MSEKFRAPDPLLIVPARGFVAGVIDVVWRLESPIEIAGREGRMYSADIGINIRGQLPRDVGVKALQGLVVRAPDGSLARVAGVESFATHGLIGPVGLLLVPLDE